MQSRQASTIPRLLSASILALLLTAAAGAQREVDPARYAKVKAGMMLNFVRYVTWPDPRFEDEEAEGEEAEEGEKSPLIVTIVGRDMMVRELEPLIRNERVHERPIELRQVDYPEPDPSTGLIDAEELEAFYQELRAAHLLFIATTEEERFQRYLTQVEDRNVLTVSDIENFALEGGMLGLTIRRGRVTFDANLEALEATDLNVSSKLLRLARIVREPERSTAS